MKYLLPLFLLFAGIPICAQTDDEAYFQRRLEEARHGDADAQDDVGTLYAEARGVKTGLSQGHILAKEECGPRECLRGV